MTYYLSQPIDSDPEQSPPVSIQFPQEELSDLRVFWGPDICRLEYLIHLVDTGRIVDETAVTAHI